MRLLAIDPGPATSGYVLWDSEAGRVLEANSDAHNATLPRDVLPRIVKQHTILVPAPIPLELAIERVACYGKPVGEPVFETVFFSGRLAEWWERVTGRPAIRMRFSDVALHHCHDRRAKESYVRQVLLDRFGGKGTKAQPGPFYGVSGHAWSAAALAIAVTDTRKEG
ncbi:MAG TPA: hypothetical protein PKJ99_18210 [Thermoanaerobaculales bacterium]|nr:hypothetical protein [Thermoanaerobaculales bacterium]